MTDENSDDLLKQLFGGNVVFEYTDAQAIEDGVLIPYVVNGRDTRHRITSNAYESLKQHYAPQYPEYKEADFYQILCLRAPASGSRGLPTMEPRRCSDNELQLSRREVRPAERRAALAPAERSRRRHDDEA
ncbi:MAG: hypothetical protein L0338_36775 [Acidobacteria bacterium]|nr:hypothetical protein [Acidobacteriota bacterium]